MARDITHRKLAAAILTTIFSVTQAGCVLFVSPSTRIDRWVGLHSDHLISTWGVPQGKALLSDGTSIITYSSSSVNTSHGICITSDCVPSVNVYSTQCQITFKTDSAGMITTWSWKGNTSECHGLIHDTSSAEDVVKAMRGAEAQPQILLAPIPTLGIRSTLLSPELAERYHLSTTRGLWLHRSNLATDERAVIADSPAALAGLRDDDVILEIDGRPIQEDRDCLVILQGRKIGDSLGMTVRRRNRTSRVTVHLTDFRFPRASLLRIWATMSTEQDGRVRYWRTDPLFLYGSGFVDRGRFKYADWEAAFVSVRRPDGSYLFDRKFFLSLDKYRPPFSGREYLFNGRVRTVNGKDNSKEQEPCSAL